MNARNGSLIGKSAKAPVAAGPGPFEGLSTRFGSVAAIDQAPAGSNRCGNQPPHRAAAVTVTVIGRSADKDSRATPAPAVMPAAVPATPGGGGGRCQRGRCK